MVGRKGVCVKQKVSRVFSNAQTPFHVQQPKGPSHLAPDFPPSSIYKYNKVFERTTHAFSNTPHSCFRFSDFFLVFIGHSSEEEWRI